MDMGAAQHRVVEADMAARELVASPTDRGVDFDSLESVALAGTVALVEVVGLVASVA